MDAHRDPHVLISSRLPDHEKIIGLPSDSARFGFVVVLCEARRQRPPGRFASRLVLAHLLGRYARWIPAYLRAGLLHEAPALCERCRSRVGGISDGTIVVHDWPDHQLRRAAAERQADRRDRMQAVTAMSHEGHADVTDLSHPKRDADVTSPRRPRDSDVTFSRAGARTHVRAGARPPQSRSLSLYLPENRSSAAAALKQLRGGMPGDSGGGGPGEGVRRRRRRWSILVGAEP